MELLKLFRLRRFWTGSTPWVVLLLAVCNWRVDLWREGLTAKHRQNLLAAATANDAAIGTTGAIRFDRSFGEDLNSFWPFLPDARQQKLVVLCGMSQMFAINQRTPQDQTISEWMDDALAGQHTRVFGLAAPNLANEEALFLLAAGLQNPSTKPHTFIFGACFDKFRNVDLRPGYLAFLAARPELQQAWGDIARRYAERYPLATEKMRATLQGLQTVQATGGDSLESRVRDDLGRWVPIVGLRKELNVQAQILLGALRNKALGITPTSKRPVIPARYRTNQEFLGLMIDLARDNGVQFITYVIPLNNLAETPYIPQQYQEFKVWLADLARREGVPTANLEDVVPTEDWGTLNGYPDFKHFRGAGHRRTAEALLAHFKALLIAPAPGNPAR